MCPPCISCSMFVILPESYYSSFNISSSILDGNTLGAPDAGTVAEWDSVGVSVLCVERHRLVWWIYL